MKNLFLPKNLEDFLTQDVTGKQISCGQIPDESRWR